MFVMFKAGRSEKRHGPASVLALAIPFEKPFIHEAQMCCTQSYKQYMSITVGILVSCLKKQTHLIYSWAKISCYVNQFDTWWFATYTFPTPGYVLHTQLLAHSMNYFQVYFQWIERHNIVYETYFFLWHFIT